MAGAPSCLPSYEGSGLKFEIYIRFLQSKHCLPSYEGSGLKSAKKALQKGLEGLPSYEGSGLK